MKVEMIFKLFNDESTMKKLRVMDAWEIMLDDERNQIPEQWWELLDSITLGESVKITLEKKDETI